MKANTSLARQERCAKRNSSWERRHPCVLVSSKAPFAIESCESRKQASQAGMPALPGQLRRTTRAISLKSPRPSSPLTMSAMR